MEKDEKDKSGLELRIIDPSIDQNDQLYNTPGFQQLLEIYEAYYPKVGFNPPWVGYVITRDEQAVGSCGFVQKPIDGRVELAYWTFQEFEGQGIASYACEALIAIAKMEDATVVITAKTAPEKNASTHILEKNGFRFKRVVQDDEIGDAWLWVLKA